MKKNIFIAAVLLLIFGGVLRAQTTAFVFQGKLQDGGTPANGTYQFQFRMFDASSGGSQVGQTLSDIPASVTNGIFAATLDFGVNSFDGAARFIEIGVRLNGSGQTYTLLNPRQAVTSTPYAVKSLKSEQSVVADNSLNLGNIPAANYTQTNDPRLSDDRNPLPDSPNYIQNTINQQTNSNFNISGEGRANILSANTQFNLGGSRVFHLSGSFNTFVGFESGNSIAGGNSNSFFGIFAGRNTTTGSNNSFFGSLAGRENLAGSENSFFGQGAGLKNTSGAGNSLFGYGAGLNNTTGTNNTFVGFVAGQSNTTESYNTFLGYRANGAAGITNSTAIGANALVTTSNTIVMGTNLVTVQIPGSLNVANTFSANSLDSATVYKIGGFRVFHLSGNFNTFVGFETGNALTTGTFNAVFGTSAGRSNTTGMNNSFFGSLAGRDNLTGNDNSFFGQAAGLKNTTGSANSFFGYGAGVDITGGARNTFIGYLAGVGNTDETDNTFIGYKANGAVGLTNATAIGANAVVTQSNTMVLGTNLVTVQVPGSLTVANTFSANALNSATVYKINNNRVFHLTGTDNTFVGLESGNSITTGGFNAFFGKESGKNNTSGFNNAFFGAYAGRDNIAGTNNAFFGANAGLSNKANFNSFFGSAAGFSNFNGTGNSFFGTQSGANNESGQNNSFFGRSAGSEVTTGSNNTFIGALSGVLDTNAAGSNNIALGYNNKFGAGVNNSIAIGTDINVTESDRVFIGKNTSEIIMGQVNAYTLRSTNLSTDIASISGGSITGLDEITSNVGTIGSLTVSALTANSTVRFNGNFFANSVQFKSFSGGSSTEVCYSPTSIQGVTYHLLVNCSSSRRYKDDIQNYTGGLSVLNRLRPVTFRWKSNQQKDIGFVAEEVNEVEPLLNNFNDEGEIEGVKYAQITTVLVNSVKEQQTQIETLQEQIKRQQEQIEALKMLICATNSTAAVCAAPKEK